MSLHRYRSPRSLRVLRAEAANATNATQLEAVVREIALFHGPLIALGVLGHHHELATGKKAMDRLREWIVRRMMSISKLSREEICRRVGEALMDASERLAFVRITRKPKLELVRLTDYTRFTGWYQSAEDAEDRWIHSGRPLASDKLYVAANAVLAVKWLYGRHDVILTPGRARSPERTLL